MSSIKTQAGVAINQYIGRDRHFSGQKPLINYWQKSPSIKTQAEVAISWDNTHQSTILAEVAINQTIGRGCYFSG